MFSVLYVLPFDFWCFAVSVGSAYRVRAAVAKNSNFSFSLHEGFRIGIYSVTYKYVLHIPKVRTEQQAIGLAGDASCPAYGKQGWETGNLPYHIFFYTGKTAVPVVVFLICLL